MRVQKGDKLEARRSRRRCFEDRNVGFYYMRTGKTSKRPRFVAYHLVLF
ncbi:hypothetical protein [Terrilactibacillus tamarindi]|nr:hypothetical protein [Terrilactibacillus tamarindi]